VTGVKGDWNEEYLWHWVEVRDYCDGVGETGVGVKWTELGRRVASVVRS